jgi:hypothetical protein
MAAKFPPREDLDRLPLPTHADWLTTPAKLRLEGKEFGPHRRRQPKKTATGVRTVINKRLFYFTPLVDRGAIQKNLPGKVP